MHDDDHPLYFIPGYYVTHGYMMCKEITGMQAYGALGAIDLRIDDYVVVDGREQQVVAFLGEIQDADAGRPVWPLILACRDLADGSYTHYAFDDLSVHEIQHMGVDAA